jgi:hypothetical protein
MLSSCNQTSPVHTPEAKPSQKYHHPNNEKLSDNSPPSKTEPPAIGVEESQVKNGE